MATKIIRKVTIRDVIGGKAEILKAAQSGRETPDAAVGKPVDLMTVIGRVIGFTPGESDNGPFLKLKGSFETTNLLTGEVISGVSTAILPNFIADLMANAIQAGGKSVDFAVKISAVYDESAATMYAFEAESLLPAQESDSIAAIKAQLAASGITLPAPAKLQALAAPAKTEPAAEPVKSGKGKK